MISVIVPIYNCEDYLKDCLLSIYKQTYSDFEIIAVNDCSTDNSANIVNQMSKEYGKMIPVTLSVNSGLSAARNAGMLRASGEYICYVDADDTIEPDYLEKLYNMSIQYDADIVIGDFKEVDEALNPMNGAYVNGNKLEGTVLSRQTKSFESGPVTIEQLVNSISVSYLDHFAVASVVAWNKLIRADIAKKNLFKEGFIHEDEFWIMPLLLSCKKIVWTSDVVYNYRIRQGSITRNSKSKDEHEKRNAAQKHVAVLDAYESRISMTESIHNIGDSERRQLKERTTYHYCANIINQYLQWYLDYQIDKKECHRYFSKRMRKALKNYSSNISKKECFKYYVFSINEKKFFKVFWNKVID